MDEELELKTFVSIQAEEIHRLEPDAMQFYLDQIHDGLLAVDVHGRFTVWNSTMERLTGLRRADVLGCNAYEVFPCLKAYADHEHLSTLMQGTSVTLPEQTLHLVASDKPRCFDIRLTPRPDCTGSVVEIYAVLQDVTERKSLDALLAKHKQTEEELRTTKDRMEAFLTNSADAIWMINQEGNVLQVNPAFESLFGWSKRDVVGGKLPIIPKELAAEIERLHERIMLGHSIAGYETQRLCRDGRLIYVSATLSPVRDIDGRVVGVSGTCRDISHNKQAEEELRTTKELFESIFNYTTDAVIVFDLESRVLAINPAGQRMSALSNENTTGEHAQLHRDIIPPSQRQKYLEVLNKRAGFAEYEVSHILQDGRRFELQVTLSPICDDLGNVNAMLLMAKDITENKKAQELLVQSEKLNIAGQLAAGVAHEIRNPLTALKGFVQLMDHSAGDNEKYLSVMASELERIEMIVSELLVLAKPQALTFKRKPVVPILEEVLTLSGTQAILHNVEILSDYADDLPDIDCDANQLKQVFINFIKNAIEAMPHGGSLRIEAHLHGQDQMRIRFQDQGTGIPKEHLARLGEPFYTTKTKGTGLGLMVSKKIIENHNGTLDIASEVGVGTTLDVYVPIPE